MDTTLQNRTAGVLILGATLAAVFLVLHHPTSLDGTPDRLLLADWSNTLVHGGMIAVLCVLNLGVSWLPDLVGERHVSVRAGRMAFAGGMAAFVGAALINGFASLGLVAGGGDSSTLALQMGVLTALNRALANLGMVLAAAAMAFWAIRMLRLDLTLKIAGGLGVGVAMLAANWLIVGRGAFGFYPALIATLAFGAWSSMIALRLMGAGRTGPATAHDPERTA